ncbi:MAG: protein translocase subunit SecD, partial [Myxococcota bacterium]
RGLPDWLLASLPGTRMPLGLELQSGIDMTVQVGLEEALLSQANRDITYLGDRAEEKGLTIEGVRRNRYDPTIEVNSPDGADALQGFFGTSMGGDYEYSSTLVEDGKSWHQFAMTGARGDEIRGQAITQVLDVLRKRVAETKVRDPVVVRKGAGRISVQLPGFSDTKTATAAIGKTAVLEFKLVDPDFRRADVPPIYTAAREALEPAAFYNDELLNDYLHEEGMLPLDREFRFEYTVELNEAGLPQRARRTPALVVVKQVVITGQDVNGADIGFDPQTQRPNVSLEFKPAGTTTFCDFTTVHVDDRFAIILDGEVQSAPSINERICGGRAQITMGQSMEAQAEAKALAVVLRTGSLNAPVQVGSVRQIGPSLGAAAIQAGGIATVLAGGVVLIFMALWYGKAGILANVALVLNILLMLAGLSLFGWTLTLPGIAGIALTIGMAVDANIIIYERIREELKMGQHARKAVEAGFKKAAVAVLDANITTAIAGVVLFSYGDVTIQGFAVTLLMGIATTLLTALFVTRSLLEIVTRRATARLRL